MYMYCRFACTLGEYGTRTLEHIQVYYMESYDLVQCGKDSAGEKSVDQMISASD